MTDEIDPFAILDAKLAKVTTKAKLELRKDDLQSRLSNHRILSTDKEIAMEELREISRQLDQIIWQPLFSVALFAKQHCEYCGSDHSIFLQFMEEQQTSAGNKVTRFIRTPRYRTDIPRKVVTQFTTTKICADCCQDFDFAFEGAEQRFGGNQFAVSGTYVQAEEGSDEA